MGPLGGPVSGVRGSRVTRPPNLKNDSRENGEVRAWIFASQSGIRNGPINAGSPANLFDLRSRLDQPPAVYDLTPDLSTKAVATVGQLTQQFVLT